MKITERLASLEFTAYLSIFNRSLTQLIMTVLPKVCKPENFETHNSLKFRFINIRGLRSNFVDCGSFLNSNSPDILALCEKNLDDSIDSGNFSAKGYLPLIRKDFVTHMVGLVVYMKKGLPFARDLSLENSGFLLMFSTGFTLLSVLLLFPLQITFYVFIHDF